MRMLTILAFCSFLTGCGGGGDETKVVGNQGPRTDHRAVAIADFDGDGFNDLVGASAFVTFGPAPRWDTS